MTKKNTPEFLATRITARILVYLYINPEIQQVYYFFVRIVVSERPYFLPLIQYVEFFYDYFISVSDTVFSKIQPIVVREVVLFYVKYNNNLRRLVQKYNTTSNPSWQVQNQ